MSTNPTSKQSGIVIQPLSLLYGLYQFVYNVVLTATTPNGTITAPPVQLSSYVRIVPTGISVYVFPQRLRLINRGLNDSIPFEPRTYSFDLDNLTDTSRLTYTYTCEIVDNGLDMGNVQSLGRTNGTVVYGASFCFNTSGKFINRSSLRSLN